MRYDILTIQELIEQVEGLKELADNFDKVETLESVLEVLHKMYDDEYKALDEWYEVELKDSNEYEWHYLNDEEDLTLLLEGRF